VKPLHLAIVVLLTSACGDDSAAGPGDGGVDQSAQAQLWCTSSACATAPCTVGCVFQRAASCSSAHPAVVERSAFASCARLCEGYSIDAETTAAGQCLGPYDGSKPGCNDSVCHYNPGCIDVGPTFDQNGAAICPPDHSCYNGIPVADLAPDCHD
jgi:hypothetical protein